MCLIKFGVETDKKVEVEPPLSVSVLQGNASKLLFVEEKKLETSSGEFPLSVC